MQPPLGAARSLRAAENPSLSSPQAAPERRFGEERTVCERVFGVEEGECEGESSGGVVGRCGRTVGAVVVPWELPARASVPLGPDRDRLPSADREKRRRPWCSTARHE